MCHDHPSATVSSASYSVESLTICALLVIRQRFDMKLDMGKEGCTYPSGTLLVRSSMYGSHRSATTWEDLLVLMRVVRDQSGLALPQEKQRIGMIILIGGLRKFVDYVRMDV